MQTIVDFYMLHRPRKCVLSVVVILLLSMGNLFTQTALAAPVSMKPHTQTTTFTLDGVTVTVDTPFLPASHFSTSKPGDATQTAVAATSDPKVHPYGAISITAVPFGTKPKSEGVPIAQAGGAATYRASLHQYRVGENNNPQPGPAITIFGQHAIGEASLIQGDTKRASSSTLIVEWVVQAGKRIWIVRVSQEEAIGAINIKSAATFLASLGFLTITSSTLSHPTTIKVSRNSIAAANTSLSDLPYPDWWSATTCVDQSGGFGSGSHPLATSYRGMFACGPTNTAACSTFGGRASCVYEWQCVELAMRYFVLTGWSSVYPGNGVDIVNNYPNSNLTKFPAARDGSQQLSIQGRPFQAGDVLSWADMSNNTTPDWSSAGHVSIVTGVTVNSSGTGSFSVIEENGLSSGTETFSINNWLLQDSTWTDNLGFHRQRIVDWLDPNSGGSNGGLPPALQSASPTLITFSGGQRELIAVGSDGHIWHAPIAATDTGTWGPWNWMGSTGGFANATPTLMTFADGQRELIAVGQDGHIWHTPIPATDTGSWGAWNWTGSTGGFAAASPTVITYADGSLELVAVSQDGHIWHTPQGLTDTGVWGRWDWLGSTGGFAAASPTLIKYATGTLELIAVGQDGHIWHDPIPSVDNGTWGRWDWLGSTGGFAAASPTLITYANGGLELIAVGQDGHIWHDPIPSVDNGTWGNWDWLGSTGGFANASPMLITYTDGSLELIAVSQDGHIWHDPIPSVDNGTWGRWDWLGSTGGFSNASPILIPFSNGWELIAVGQDGHVWHDPIPTIDNGTWGRWDWLGSTGGFV